jgi:hypothetical protein
MSNFNWVEKLQLDIEDNEDGSATITISWDQEDPALRFWTELGEEKQQEWLMEVLKDSIKIIDPLDTEHDSEESNEADTCPH